MILSPYHAPLIPFISAILAFFLFCFQMRDRGNFIIPLPQDLCTGCSLPRTPFPPYLNNSLSHFWNLLKCHLIREPFLDCSLKQKPWAHHSTPYPQFLFTVFIPSWYIICLLVCFLSAFLTRMKPLYEQVVCLSFTAELLAPKQYQLNILATFHNNILHLQLKCYMKWKKKCMKKYTYYLWYTVISSLLFCFLLKY